MTAPKLPAGESLPEYDDQHPEGVDIAALVSWVTAHGDLGWGMERTPEQAKTVRTVLAALAAVGDATLVKNGTYRAMRRDGADIERLAAWFANHNMAVQLVEHDGNPVSAAIEALALSRRVALEFAGRIKNMTEGITR